jgi:hypothetical protein
MVRSAAAKRRRVADTQAWRARQKRGAAVYPVEVDGELFDLLERFGGLDARSVLSLADRSAAARELCAE